MIRSVSVEADISFKREIPPFLPHLCICFITVNILPRAALPSERGYSLLPKGNYFRTMDGNNGSKPNTGSPRRNLPSAAPAVAPAEEVRGQNFPMLDLFRNFQVFLFAILLAAFIMKICSGYGYTSVIYGVDSPPMVSTYSGAVRGKLLKVEGVDVKAFLGIPYAEPPVGDRRFQRAVPKQNWIGVYDASTKPCPCMQYSNKDFDWIAKSPPTEDCLYLNIWAPVSKEFYDSESTGKPVLLWIHGGGFFAGSSEIDIYDGALLAAETNTIVVSINYRLGVFGFLTIGNLDAPGNMGLHDQLLAMEWVKLNIRQFGGDPEKITLFGQSAGAVSVGLHHVSPLSGNLFRRGIMQSGSPYHPLLAADPSIMVFVSNIFATAAGCANETNNLLTDPSSTMGCLKMMDPMHLAIVESVMLQKQPFVFLPVHGDDFMPENPIKAMNEGNFHCKELLLGSTKDEGSAFIHYVMPDMFGAQVAPDLTVEQAKLLITGLFQNSTNPPPQAVVDFYLKDARDDDPNANRKAVYNSYGDFIFHCPTIFFAEKFAESGDAYFYSFTHKSSHSQWGDWMGVPHFEDVPYVFGQPLRNSTSYTPDEKIFSKNMMRKWANFARFGVPISSKSDMWPKFTHDHPFYMELNPKNRNVGEGLRSKACDFWRNYLF